MEPLVGINLPHDEQSPGFRQHRLGRRRLLGTTAAAGLGWLTPVANVLARACRAHPREPAQSVILLWLAGGPSQLETFDPQPGAKISAGTRAIRTALPGVQLAAGFDAWPKRWRTCRSCGPWSAKRGITSVEHTW